MQLIDFGQMMTKKSVGFTSGRLKALKRGGIDLC